MERRSPVHTGFIYREMVLRLTITCMAWQCFVDACAVLSCEQEHLVLRCRYEVIESMNSREVPAWISTKSSDHRSHHP